MKQFSFSDMNRASGEILETALIEPVSLTKHGREKLIIMSADRYRKLTENPQAEAFGLNNLPRDVRCELMDGLDAILGPVDKVWQPYFSGGQREECRERFSGLIVSCRNSAELFEAIEHPFDAVSILIGSKVAGRRVLAVSLRRNDGPDPMDQQFLAQEIAVIPFVGKKQPRFADRYCQ